MFKTSPNIWHTTNLEVPSNSQQFQLGRKIAAMITQASWRTAQGGCQDLENQGMRGFRAGKTNKTRLVELCGKKSGTEIPQGFTVETGPG